MESTYSHLTDDDRIKTVEIDSGYREPEEEDSPLTPPVCTICGEPLENDDVACSVCGMMYTPDAKATQEQIEESMYEAKGEVENEEEESLDTVKEQMLEEITSDPELMKALAKEVKDQ